jgi:hypothetical protein
LSGDINGWSKRLMERGENDGERSIDGESDGERSMKIVE